MVDGLQGISLEQVKDLCVGQEGSSVSMTIHRDGEPDATITMVCLLLILSQVS